MFFAFRYAFIWENKKKERAIERGDVVVEDSNLTAFMDMTDKQNPK